MAKTTPWILSLACLGMLTGCTSEASRQRAEQAQIKRDIAQQDEDTQAKEGYDERNNAKMLQEQDRLDGIEQKRSGNAYAHSCRKVTSASADLNAVAVDKSQCSPDQLKLEEEAERRQPFDKAFADVAARETKR